MRHHQQRLLLLLALLVLLHVGDVQAVSDTLAAGNSQTKDYCENTQMINFPDLTWLQSPAKIVYYKTCQVWDCATNYTGRGCNEQCKQDIRVCSAGKRLTECDPPYHPTCVTCRQESTEVVEGGYSFGVYNPSNKQYDLLHGRGSFEYAKLYPVSTFVEKPTMTTRPVVPYPTSSSTSQLGIWNDVMFPAKSWRAAWWAAGKIDLQYRPGGVEPGMALSDVFMILQAPSATIKMCDIDTRLYNVVPGLLYEFRYRQQMKYKDDIQLSTNLYEGLGIEVYTLPSTSVWTRNRRLFDFTPLDTSDDSVIWNTNGCLSIEFTMGESNAVWLDDIRVFVNMFWNSGFTNKAFGVKSWDNVSPTGCTGQMLGSGGVDGYATLFRTCGISQTVQLLEPKNYGNLTAMFSMDVRGEGLLLVEYQYYLSTIQYTKTIVYKHIVPDLDNVWQSLTIPVNIDERATRTQFKISNIQPVVELQPGELLMSIDIDNVVMYIDNERCPIGECGDISTHTFVNGQCEPCAGVATLNKCNSNQRIVGCMATDKGMISKCGACVVPGNSRGSFISGQVEECSFDCGEGYFYTRMGIGGTGPTCTRCAAVGEVRCDVGWKLKNCTRESQTTCIPCDLLDEYDSYVMYTKNTSAECTHACIPGQFEYVNSEGESTCFPCTDSICGATNNGLSSMRQLPGAQYTSHCSNTHDSECISCKTEDPSLHFTGNGEVIGAWCGHECIPGSMPCPSCTWDPAKATVVQNTQLYRYDPSINEPLTPLLQEQTIHFSNTLFLRFSGAITIFTPSVDIETILIMQLMDMNGNNVGHAVNVLELTPLVPPSAFTMIRGGIDAMFINNAPVQVFDIIVNVTDRFNPNYGGTQVKYELVVSGDGAPHFTLHSFLVESMNIPTTGCCNIGTYCRPCEYAAGTTGPLPSNAFWESPNNCTWTCNKQYELLPGGNGHTCEFCIEPECPVGQYWTACNVCAVCKAPPGNTYFTAAGTTRYDNTSCPTSCVEGFYYHENHKICVKCTESNALNCSTKRYGQFFEQACGSFSDAICIDCQICARGFNASTSCSISMDTVCTKCDTSLLRMPALTATSGVTWQLGLTQNDYCVWECDVGLMYNTLTNTCTKCGNDQCGVGYYGTNCTLENNYTGCLQCITPENSVVLSSGFMSLPTSCLWECTVEQIYNATENKCIPKPVVVPVVLNIEVVVTQCVSSICGFGKFINQTLGSMSQADNRPCDTRCEACPPLPFRMNLDTPQTLAVYTRKGSCEWVCITPLMQQGNTCIPIQ
jgi:hypothetical protein